MGCFVVAGFVLTSVSRGPSAIAELLVKMAGNVLTLVWQKCSYSVCCLWHPLIDPEVIKIRGQRSWSCCYQNALPVDKNAYRFLVLSEQSELWLVVIMANWVVLCEVTQFAATVAYHIVNSVKMKWGQMRWDEYVI